MFGLQSRLYRPCNLRIPIPGPGGGGGLCTKLLWPGGGGGGGEGVSVPLEAVQHPQESPSEKHPKQGFKDRPSDTLKHVTWTYFYITNGDDSNLNLSHSYLKPGLC